MATRASWNGPAEDTNKLRALAGHLMKTRFREQWQWRADIAPPQWAIDEKLIPTGNLLKGIHKGQSIGDLSYSYLDLYAKDISYGPTEIETEQIKVGGCTLTYPTGWAPVTVTMTVRDHSDERVAKFFDALAGLVGNKDGTFNIPYGSRGYLSKLTLYSIDGNSQTESQVWNMLPTKRGDVQAAVDGQGFLEFPLTFVQFRSLGE